MIGQHSGPVIPATTHDPAFPLPLLLPLLPGSPALTRDRTRGLVATRLPRTDIGYLLTHPVHGAKLAVHTTTGKVLLLDRQHPRLRFVPHATSWWPNLSALMAETKLGSSLTAGLLELIRLHASDLAETETALLAIADPDRAREVLHALRVPSLRYRS